MKVAWLTALVEVL